MREGTIGTTHTAPGTFKSAPSHTAILTPFVPPGPLCTLFWVELINEEGDPLGFEYLAFAERASCACDNSVHPPPTQGVCYCRQFLRVVLATGLLDNGCSVSSGSHLAHQVAQLLCTHVCITFQKHSHYAMGYTSPAGVQGVPPPV